MKSRIAPRPRLNTETSHSHGKEAIYAAVQQSIEIICFLKLAALLETEIGHIKVAITPYFCKSEGRLRAARDAANQRDIFR
jgi:hypothetical protein